jgi:hypothetical protein
VGWISVFDKHTDIISDSQLVQFWCFDFEKLKSSYNSSDYSLPVRSSLFNTFKVMNSSYDLRIRLRHFTIWVGDYGDLNQFFCIGIPYRMNSKIVNIFKNNFESMPGFVLWNYDRLPAVPLIPVYRYEYGRIIEYSYETSLAGKFKIDNGEDSFNTGLTVQYRRWVSAEGLDTKQIYRG